METKMRSAVQILFLLFISSPCMAGAFRGIAKDISEQALHLGVKKIAVLPFEAIDGSNLNEGREISEKMTTRFVRLRKIAVVERPLLKKVLDEQALSDTGAINPDQIKAIGRIASVDAIITGSYESDGETLTIDARLINTETGVIMAASEKKAPYKARPAGDYADRSGQSLWIPAPTLDVPAPTIFSSDDPDERDSMADVDPNAHNGCIEASKRVDALESQIIDLKARYWARRLKQGFSFTGLTHNPGSEITSPELKRRFYARLRNWYEQLEIPPLNASELRLFATIDSKAIQIHDDCGI